MEPVVANRWNRWRAARRGGWLLLAPALLQCLPGVAVAASNKPPAPEARLPFDALGIPPLSANFLSVGASMLTVNFVDDRHLLVTYGSRGLVPREANDPEGDQDRVVKAELVELPAGKVLSRTEWHLHDHGRYLWPLGDGRFLLRIRQDLSVFAPLANLEAHEPWVRSSFAHRRGELQGIVLSADDKLLTVMTAPATVKVDADPTQPKRTVNVSGTGDVVDPMAGYVVMDFYRMTGKGSGSAPLVLEHAGSVRSPEAIRLPVNADGYLRSQTAGRGKWKVSFENFEGATRALAPVGSSCPPVLLLPSRGQLLAFTCRGFNPDAITLQVYDFAGHETWEEPIGEVPVTPSFAYAPQAGRFAMSRLLPVASAPPGQGQAEGPTMPAQELRVYQTQSGDLLLKVNVTPTFRTAENYDLSPDGMHAVVVHDGELDVYRLPELSKADREDLEDVRHMEPPASAGPINLRKLAEDDAQQAPLQGAEGIKSAEGMVAPAGVAGSAAGNEAAQAAAAQGGPVNGDNNGPRKAPSLLNPGESPEFKPK